MDASLRTMLHDKNPLNSTQWQENIFRLEFILLRLPKVINRILIH